MDMRKRIAWKHIVNQKGNIYLMDEAEKTYILDFNKLKSTSKKHFDRMHLFHSVAIYAFPIILIILTAPFEPNIIAKLGIVFISLAFVYLIEFLVMTMIILPKNIIDILEEKKH